MRVVVLGAGIIGVTSAWFLSRAGYQVSVIERQSASALETSFANGGQISVSQAEPWANPDAIYKIIKWLGREDAPLLFRLQNDPQQWLWGLRFLRECTHGRHARNLRHLVNLGLFSRATLQELRQQLNLQYHQQQRGILQLHCDPREYHHARNAAAIMSKQGCKRIDLSLSQAIELEPALTQSKIKLCGAIYSPDDESGDAHLFTRALTEHAQRAGVSFRFGQHVKQLHQIGNRISHIDIQNEQGQHQTIDADAYVMAAGSYSPLLLRTIGIHLPIYPAKGYSLTIPLRNGDIAPHTSITDENQKLVFSRLGNRLRIAGTAELAGYNTDINPQRCAAILARCRSLFPEIIGESEPQSWAGLRPATPNNMPFIGQSRYSNLYLNTGHGTLGWTQSCGSAAALAQLMQGKRPEVDFPFLYATS